DKQRGSAPGAPAAGELAHTGSSNATNAALGAGAALLIAGGAGTLFAVRRRAAR
ncbi:LAETG motif-containing sortase-dependent surface protein, partial [Streptomyces sp. WAC06614]|uniref:LAETG motif-containing sortase-dependent surface protein n=1 Tax=Streptomyces sp. WAC06614 TaxID=2487416 RepID=UPI000F79EE27